MADHRGRGHTHVVFAERIPMKDLELIPRAKHVSLTIFAQAEHLAVGCPGRGSEGATRQSLSLVNRVARPRIEAGDQTAVVQDVDRGLTGDQLRGARASRRA